MTSTIVQLCYVITAIFIQVFIVPSEFLLRDVNSKKWKNVQVCTFHLRIVLTQQLDALGLIRKACNNLKTVFFSAMFSSNIFTSSISFNLSAWYSNQLWIMAAYILKTIHTWINREKSLREKYYLQRYYLLRWGKKIVSSCVPNVLRICCGTCRTTREIRHF